jgi:hypothetical protein
LSASCTSRIWRPGSVFPSSSLWTRCPSPCRWWHCSCERWPGCSFLEPEFLKKFFFVLIQNQILWNDELTFRSLAWKMFHLSYVLVPFKVHKQKGVWSIIYFIPDEILSHCKRWSYFRSKSQSIKKLK